MKKVVAPDFITPLIGWRFWRVVSENLMNNGLDLWLTSIMKLIKWPPKKRFKAECLCGYSYYFYELHTNGPPEVDPCGIYAYNSPQHAFSDPLFRIIPKGVVFGKVKLWGKVQKHQFGYRAQFAYPFSLMLAVCDECKRLINLESEFFVLRVLNTFMEEEKTFAFSQFICRNCLSLVGLSERDIEGKKVVHILQKKYGVQIEEGEIDLTPKMHYLG
jgi:hypothetical protein